MFAPINAAAVGVKSTQWVRPSDWLAMPAIGESDEKFVGLKAVSDDEANFLALAFAGAYTVDWGDGTVSDHASGSQAEHLYNYAAISAGTLSSRGYKQVIVVAYPQAGSHLTSIHLQQKHSQAGLPKYENGWLDIKVSAAYLTDMIVGAASTTIDVRMLEHVELDRNAITNFTAMFYNCIGLRQVGAFNTSSGTNFTSMFNSCYSLDSVSLLDLSSATSMANMFMACSSLSTVPLFDTHLCTNFSSMFQSCYSMSNVPLMNTSAGTNFTSMFQSCYTLTEVPLLNTGAGTTFTSMFYICPALKIVPLLDLGLGVTFTDMFSNCYSLRTVPLFNLSSGVTFTTMFASCTTLESIPAFNLSSGVTFTGMFSSCYTLLAVPLISVANGTAFTSIFATCTSLATGALSGTTRAISYYGCKLSTNAIVAIFNGLGTASGAQTITVSMNYGYAALSAGQRAIATNKGWTIA